MRLCERARQLVKKFIVTAAGSWEWKKSRVDIIRVAFLLKIVSVCRLITSAAAADRLTIYCAIRRATDAGNCEDWNKLEMFMSDVEYENFTEGHVIIF